ncbi:TetR/AcrR family transcriptional regulator [Bacillus spizizenii]|uniref:TetR/AcrR family transcriptional regulator n=1 Tax=Bacillus spizizenii TaxID=96241 RepID=UPI00165A9FC5|nr:TetR/AcrR family transcriptional regulator [Bacillus spizizenii]MEC0724665.1 TetR/AcrR family transcriptional regulator [Bacillus spizizenii]MEC1599847.1 TetR/AcrR family transcriptional regulator [Bacillus spizizenii]MEC1643565.1 TetR/AcrR family transcriptional regulator [Bacillus spizizenii]
MEARKDLRVIKTNINIRNTFIKLLNEKDFNSITVQNILDRALINRTTFYKHYRDKYDLAEKITNDFLEDFKSFMEVRFSNKENFDDLLKVIDKAYDMFYEQRLTILGLGKIRTEKINLHANIQAILKQKYTEFAKNYVKAKGNINYQACIFASLSMETFKFMLESQETYSARELIQELKNFYTVMTPTSLKEKE